MCAIIKVVCSAIFEVLLKLYIKVPTGESLQEVVCGYEHEWGVPQCAGVVGHG